MAARKAYIRLLISILIYSSGFLDMFLTFSTPKVLIILGLIAWSVYPIVTGGKSTTATPFPGDEGSRRLLNIFIFWQMFVLLRGVVFNYGIIGAAGQLGNQYSILAFLLPLVVYLNPRQFDFKVFVQVLTLVGLVFVFFVWLNRGSLFSTDVFEIDRMMMSDEEAETKGTWLKSIMYVGKVFMMMGFLLFLPAYINKKRYIFVLICWGITLFSCMIGGRRGQSVTLIIMGLLSVYFYITRKRSASNFFKFALMVGALLAVAFYVYSSFTSMFSLMESRLDVDSRSGLYAFFWSDMGSGLDWIWGRGTGGTYYCPMMEGDNMVTYRNVIESGLLFIILSGGVISLVLYIIVLMKAVIKGFFHSRNQLTKAFAAYIAVSLFNLIPFGLPECSITFFVVWIGVAICGSPYYRNLTDIEVKQLFR